jgi:simple sugar transport system substrate-binding protein/basic membrane protein A
MSDHQGFRRRTLIAAAMAGAAAPLGGRAARAQAAPMKVAMLLPGSINDQSWNAQGHAGLLALRGQGAEIAFSENVQPADHVEAMRDYARRGFTAVIGHSGRFLSAAQRVGPEFARTTFIVGSGSGGQGRNVVSVDYDNAQIGFLSGVLAARLSRSGKVASINSLEGLPNVVAQVGGFRQGVKSVRPEAEVRVIYISQMEDAAMAREAGLAAISSGADVLFGKLNAGQSGIIQAAKDRGAFATGRSLGHVGSAPETVLTAIIERWAEMYVAAVKDGAEGKLAAGVQLYGYTAPAGSGAGFSFAADQPFSPAVPAAVAAEIAALQARFASGALALTVTREDARGGV